MKKILFIVMLIILASTPFGILGHELWHIIFAKIVGREVWAICVNFEDGFYASVLTKEDVGDVTKYR